VTTIVFVAAPETKTPALPIVTRPEEVEDDSDKIDVSLTFHCNLFVLSSNNM
jgi:hypothetical protein